MVRIVKIAWRLFVFRLKKYYRDGFLGFDLLPVKSAPVRFIYNYSHIELLYC